MPGSEGVKLETILKNSANLTRKVFENDLKLNSSFKISRSDLTWKELHRIHYFQMSWSINMRFKLAVLHVKILTVIQNQCRTRSAASTFKELIDKGVD